MKIKLTNDKEKRAYLQHIGTNKRSSWLLKWLKLETYIPNLVKERRVVGREDAFKDK